jgi:ubiquitin carboxyl-terminal hydrolase L3
LGIRSSFVLSESKLFLISQQIDLETDSVLKKFLDETKSMSPEERGKALSDNKELMEIQSAVDPKAKPGDAEFHYVAIVCCDSMLYEFDGTKLGPKAHGATKAETFVQDAAQACKKFIEANPGEHRFSVLALAAADA